MVNAIVLAGATNSGTLQECSNAAYEAMIEINGIPMVQYVVDALSKTERINKIFLVGPGELRSEIKGNFEFVTSGATILDSIKNGIAAAGMQQKVLLVTSDIPMVTGSMLDQFISMCSKQQADFYYPIIEKEINEKFYPGVRRTYVQLRDGIFTGGNIFLLNPAILDRCWGIIHKLFLYRKKPWKLCQLLGWKFVFKLIFHTLTIHEAEKQVELLMGVKGVAIICPYPEIGIDVDKPSDYRLVQQRFTTC